MLRGPAQPARPARSARQARPAVQLRSAQFSSTQSDPATANDRLSNSEHQATEQPRTLSDTATTNTERPGNREHRPTEHSRPPTDRATANTERPGNREHRAKKIKRRKQRKQSKPQQSTKTINNSKDRTSISTHISSYGPKPGRALGHKNLALQADQYIPSQGPS